MEPRLFRRGDKDLDWLIEGPPHLQWSHAFSGVETTSGGGATFTSQLDLQWSHAFSGVETPSIRIAFVPLIPFNGATPFQAWRLSVRQRTNLRIISFNGATPFQAWRPDGCRV